MKSEKIHQPRFYMSRSNSSNSTSEYAKNDEQTDIRYGKNKTSQKSGRTAVQNRRRQSVPSICSGEITSSGTKSPRILRKPRRQTSMLMANDHSNLVYAKQQPENDQSTSPVIDLIKVVARFRPASNDAEEVPLSFKTGSVTLQNPLIFGRQPSNLQFQFDEVLPPLTSQQSLFSQFEPMLEHALLGHHAAALFYGYRGSGKSYSCFGSADEPGALPLSIDWLLKNTGVAGISLSMVEIYMDELFDLLSPVRQELRIRENNDCCSFQPAVTVANITTQAEANTYISEGMRRRTISMMHNNTVSSKAHCITIVYIDKSHCSSTGPSSMQQSQIMQRSVIYFCDLASSERLSSASSAAARQETNIINKSLLYLGLTLQSLTEGAPHVPYRDNMLTWLLSSVLGGASLLTLVLTCSSDASFARQTCQTLHFGTRIKHVKLAVKPTAHLIERLTKQVDGLLLRISELETVQSVYDDMIEKLSVPLADSDVVADSSILIQTQRNISDTCNDDAPFCRMDSEFLDQLMALKLQHDADVLKYSTLLANSAADAIKQQQLADRAIKERDELIARYERKISMLNASFEQSKSLEVIPEQSSVEDTRNTELEQLLLSDKSTTSYSNIDFVHQNMRQDIAAHEASFIEYAGQLEHSELQGYTQTPVSEDKLAVYNSTNESNVPCGHFSMAFTTNPEQLAEKNKCFTHNDDRRLPSELSAAQPTSQNVATVADKQIQTSCDVVNEDTGTAAYEQYLVALKDENALLATKLHALQEEADIFIKSFHHKFEEQEKTISDLFKELKRTREELEFKKHAECATTTLDAAQSFYSPKMTTNSVNINSALLLKNPKFVALGWHRRLMKLRRDPLTD